MNDQHRAAHDMSEARHMLDLAARLAMRAAGDAEPNPLVGAVLVRDARVIGLGHHRRFGGPHAEPEALADCQRRGETARGATLYVTLEPCAHHGKTPPCADALIQAGVARVVFARADPNPLAQGGAARLRAAGIDAVLSTDSEPATGLGAPFAKRIVTGFPWVIAKWAQTIDGRIATRTGESKWISGERARARVHRLRGRVDAILTGLGTVLADDPRLTARGLRRVRRVARRVVLDPNLDIPLGSALVRSARDAPVVIACAAGLPETAIAADKANALRAAGAEVLATPPGPGGLDLGQLLRTLTGRWDATNVLVEAGAGVLSSLFDADLVDEAVVYLAPLLLGDELARPVARGRIAGTLSEGRRFTLARLKRLDDDVEIVYRRQRVRPD